MARCPASSPLIAFIVLLSFLFSDVAAAGGAWLTESGGADMAMASAGSAALAVDASTLAANPAGIVELQGNRLLITAMPLLLDIEGSGDGATTGSIRNHGGPTPAGALFATHSDGRWAAGLGVYSYFGLGFDYGQQWSGARAVQSADFLSMNIAPAVAYRLSDRVSIGGTFSAQYASAQARLAIANNLPFYGSPTELPDGQLRLEGDSWALGGSVGAIYNHSVATRFGLAWTAPVSHHMNLDLNARKLRPELDALLRQSGSAGFDMSLPQQYRVSAVHCLSADTLVAGSIAWQQWSDFGKAQLQVGNTSAPLFEDGLRDTWGVAIGLHHRIHPNWRVSGGVGYDSSPVVKNWAPIYFPVADQLRLALGADYRYSNALLLRSAVSVVNQGAVNVGQDSYPIQLPGMPAATGKIESSRIYLGAVSVDYRF